METLKEKPAAQIGCLSRLVMSKPKQLNITKWLRDNEGGKWRYDNMATWWCDDEKRHMSRTAAFGDEEGLAPAQYWLYEKGKTPRMIHFHLHNGKVDGE